MYATFGDDRLKGSGVAMGRISHFPIDLRRRPSNTIALPCECVILQIDFDLLKLLLKSGSLFGTRCRAYNLISIGRTWGLLVDFDSIVF